MQGNPVSLLKSLFILSWEQIQRRKLPNQVRQSVPQQVRSELPLSTDCKEISQHLTQL